jgi:hypothetical protein
MTSATATAKDDALAEEVVYLSLAATGDTYVSKLGAPLAVVVTPTTAGTMRYVSISGRTLTFTFESGAALTCYCVIKGRL